MELTDTSIATTSLLSMNDLAECQCITDRICEKYPWFDKLDALQQGKIKYSIVTTISLLKMCIRLNNEAHFRWSCMWVYVLLSSRMRQLTDEQVKDHLIQSYNIMLENIDDIVPPEEKAMAESMLRGTVEDTRNAKYEDSLEDYINNDPYADIKKEYLRLLLDKDISSAVKYLFAQAETISLQDIYTQIIGKVMYEVGELWHQNKITVAQEHYCSEATQLIMSQFYTRILERPKTGKKVVIACPGGELHDIGARMASNLFEYEGWTSIFLGAAVPVADLMTTLETEKPDLCVLSASMSKEVLNYPKMVEEIKAKFPAVKIAAGGFAFRDMEHPEKIIAADIFAKDSAELIEKTKEIFK
jgi:methanogenic corrinoid protein MtbC1